MFGLLKPKKAEDVLDHWYTLVPEFQFSTNEFYGAVEQELKRRLVPGLEIERVDFSEGGLLSANRVYLRMIRERLVFDVCAVNLPDHRILHDSAPPMSVSFVSLAWPAAWTRVCRISSTLSPSVPWDCFYRTN